MNTQYVTKNLPCLLLCTALIAACSTTQTDNHDAKNIILIENENEGTTDWLIDVPYDTCAYPDHQNCRRENIEGYCSHASIKAGDTLSIFVSTNPESRYNLDIYRMGYYGGKGGRLMRSFDDLQGKQQITPPADPKTNFFECKWDVAVSFAIPAEWISGVYIGKLTSLRDSSQAYVVLLSRITGRLISFSNVLI